MGTVSLPGVDANATLAQLREIVAETNQVMEWLSNGQIDFKNVRARSIIADRLKANTITANEIAVNTITADRMNVSELSAIAADLGHITAGLIEAVTIIGSEIKTSNDVYPYIVLSAIGNLLTAFKDANNYIAIDPDLTGTPTLKFAAGAVEAVTSFVGAIYSIISVGGDIALTADSGTLRLRAGNLTINGSTGYTGSFSTGTNTVTVRNGIITGVS